VDATEYRAPTLLIDGRSVALEVAKNVAEVYQNKEAWFRNEVQKIQIPWEEGHVRINVRRSNLLVDAMEAFESVKKDDMHKIFRFEFQGEPGIDAGGVRFSTARGAK